MMKAPPLASCSSTATTEVPLDEETPLLISDDSKGRNEDLRRGDCCVSSSSSSSSKEAEERQESRLKFSWRLLFVTTWVFCFIFGVFIVSFYTKTVLQDELEAWELVVPNMYQEECPVANRSLLWHFVGGAYMMIFGPLQLVKAIRQYNIQIHKWMGRLFILASLLTVMGGLSYLYFVGRRAAADYGPVNSYVATVVFGICVLISTIETYRHAAITKRIDLHQLWALRLVALQVGNLLFRLYLVAAFAMLPEDYVGPALSAVFWAYFVLNLAFVEYYWRFHKNKKEELSTSARTNKSSSVSRRFAAPIKIAGFWLAALFLLVTGVLFSGVLWVPASVYSLDTFIAYRQRLGF